MPVVDETADRRRLRGEAQWARDAARFAPRGWCFDAGMGGFIWRPEGGSDDGPQYAVYGGTSFTVGTWSVYRWGVDGNGPVGLRMEQTTQPWHAFEAAQRHWRAHVAAKETP